MDVRTSPVICHSEFDSVEGSDQLFFSVEESFNPGCFVDFDSLLCRSHHRKSGLQIPGEGGFELCCRSFGMFVHVVQDYRQN